MQTEGSPREFQQSGLGACISSEEYTTLVDDVQDVLRFALLFDHLQQLEDFQRVLVRFESIDNIVCVFLFVCSPLTLQKIAPEPQFLWVHWFVCYNLCSVFEILQAKRFKLCFQQRGRFASEVLNPILKSVGLVLLGVAAKLEATRNLPHHFLLLIAKIKAFNLAILSFGSRRLHSECSSSSCLSQAFALDYFSERLIFTFLEFQPSILQFFGASIILLETQNIVSSSLTNVSLEVFGSFASGFAHSESDLDLTLNYSYYMTLDKSQSIEILKCVDPALYSLNLLQSSIYTARIPVLKLREPISGVPADLSASNPISVLSHRLLALYSEMDERVRVLIFVIRKWSKVQGIGDPLHGGLGTFAFTLLVIHFLQNTRPIILPVLKLPDFRQAVDVESSFLNISNQVHAFSQDSTRKCNLQSLKTLIVQLFSYYSSFDFSRGVISIRNCKLAKISGRNQLLSISSRFVPRQIHYIAIEDPCNYSHNVASAVNEEMTKLIQMCFVRGYRIVSKEDANINDLFSVPSRHPSNTPDRSKMIGWKRIRQQA